MAAIDEYQKMVDNVTKPGKKIDLKNDDITIKVAKSTKPIVNVSLIAGENSTFLATSEDNPATVLTHERMSIVSKGEPYPIEPDFGKKTIEEKLAYIRTLQDSKNVETLRTVWNTTGFFQWSPADDDLLYCGGSVIVVGFSNKSRTQALPWMTILLSDIENLPENTPNLPVLWLGPVQTVIPVEMIEKLIDPTGETKIDEKWSISFTWDDYGLRTGLFDWTGRYGTGGGVLLATAALGYKANYESNPITILDGDRKSHTFNVVCLPMQSDEFWGIPDDDGYKSHYEPGTEDIPIQIDGEDLEVAGCWIFLYDVIKDLKPNEVDAIFINEEGLIVDLGELGRLSDFERRGNEWYCYYDFGLAAPKFANGENVVLDLSTHDPRLGKIHFKGLTLA